MSAFHGKYLLIDNNNEFVEIIHRDSALILQYPIQIQSTLQNGLRIFAKQKPLIRAVIISTAFFKSKEALEEFVQKN